MCYTQKMIPSCARVFVCVCNESYVSLLFCFCYMLCERAGDLYHLSMHRCVRVCFSAAQFVIGMISCMHLSAFVSENELQKCACIAREGEIDSVTQFVCVSHWSQGRSGPSTGSTWSQADDLPRGGYTLMINLCPVLSFYCTDLCRICDALHCLTLRRRTL